MKIVRERPPNYDKIVAAFPLVARQRGIFFAYDDTIFNPDGAELTPSLIAHEVAHCERQQLFAASGADGWWTCYCADPLFRLEEEIIAHRAEWRDFVARGHGRHERRAYLARISKRLASPLYGALTSASRAKEIIAGTA